MSKSNWARILVVGAVSGFTIGTVGVALDVPVWLSLTACGVVGWFIPRLVVRQ